MDPRVFSDLQAALGVDPSIISSALAAFEDNCVKVAYQLFKDRKGDRSCKVYRYYFLLCSFRLRGWVRRDLREVVLVFFCFCFQWSLFRSRMIRIVLSPRRGRLRYRHRG